METARGHSFLRTPDSTAQEQPAPPEQIDGTQDNRSILERTQILQEATGGLAGLGAAIVVTLLICGALTR